jgi:invasion protein IalB
MLAAIAAIFANPLLQSAVLAIALAVAAGPYALAQQSDPAPAAPKPKPAKKPAKPATPEAAPPAAQQMPPVQPQPGQAQQQGQGGQQQVQLIYSPWTKFCLKGQPGQAPDPNAKQVCFTGKDARIESGMPVVAAVLIEPEGQERKILRVTLPLGMQLVHGTRVIIDQNQPATAPYVICFTNGCMADYEANADMVGKLKKGQGLVVQGINSTGQPISLTLPLADFAKAYDGPPTDPKDSRRNSASCRMSCSGVRTRRARSSKPRRAPQPHRQRRRRRPARPSRSQPQSLRSFEAIQADTQRLDCLGHGAPRNKIGGAQGEDLFDQCVVAWRGR